MKPMKQSASLVAVLALAGCGGGSSVMMAAKPEVPAATVPVQAPDPEPDPDPAPVAKPEVPEFPDPATLLRSHDRLGLADGFTATEVDVSMFLLANMPYYAEQPGGRGLAVADSGPRAAAAGYELRRAATYRADHAVMGGQQTEVVERVNPEVVTRRQAGNFSGGHCFPARGECIVGHPASPWGVSDGRGYTVKTPIEDMPYLNNAMRESSEGVRTRNDVNLRYWSSGERAVPWAGWKVDTATDTWSGYGAWNEWSGFGLVMLSHNHQWDLYDSAIYFTIAGGDLTGSRPSAEFTGTYRGAAVARANDLSFIADGSVDMTVRVGGANPTLDISIGDWQGYNLTETGAIGRPSAVSIQDIDVRNIPIKADGTFNVERDYWRDHTGELIAGQRYPGYPRDWHKRVRGAFYGPGGGEAAGVFSSVGKIDANGNQSGIVGAFGARKPDDPE